MSTNPIPVAPSPLSSSGKGTRPPVAVATAAPAPDPRPPVTSMERLSDHPASGIHASLDPRPTRPQEYVLDHSPVVPSLRTVSKSKLLHVLDDLRDRTAPENREFEQRLIADIAENGIRVPLIGYEEGDCVRIIDGETRFRALLLGPRDTAQVLVYAEKPSDAEIHLAGLQANLMRQDMNDLEKAEGFLKAMKLQGWNQAQLARRLNVSQSSVAKCLSISKKLCQAVQEMVAAGEVPPRAAYTIASKVADPAAQIELAKKVKDGLLCVESLEDRFRSPKGKKAKQKKAQIKVEGAVIEYPDEWLWEKLCNVFTRVLEGVKRGMKTPDISPAVLLQSLLRG